MEALKETSVLKFNSNTLQEVRSLYDLNKPGRMEEAIKLLEDWIQKQEHFIIKKFDRDYLERLIIANKGSTERAKYKLDKLCTFRTLLPEFFGYFDLREIWSIPHIKDIMSDGIMTKMTPENYRVYMVKINNVNYVTEEMVSAFNKLSVLYWEYVYKHDYPAGFVIVNDLRYISILDYVSKINITELRRMVTVLREGYSMRVKAVHLLTDSKLVESLISIMNSIFPTKVAQRIYCHSTLESLYQMVPKEILCSEYGGHELSLDDLRNLWIDTLSSQENRDYMKMVSVLRTDESKRIGGKVSEQYLPGSFRTLSID